MREILFRGKRIDTGEWVEGHLYITHSGEYEIGCYNRELNIERWTHVVDPSTVGQYTGLQDKNGKRIFEGDIIRDGDDIYLCFWDGCNVEFGVKNKDFSFGIAYLPITEYEVIGNIHDSPELMDGGAEE